MVSSCTSSSSSKFSQRDVSLGEETSENHNVTINSKHLFLNFYWKFTFALKNRMTDRTSHLAGLWIGDVISNTSHSNKAGSTIVKRAGLTGKGSRSTAVLP
jgi:hypothetical protein